MPAAEKVPAGRGRGRPGVIDREAVAAAAFRAWGDRGVRATTWADLAAATGVSVRTLMRHYPDPTDIAWVGVPSAVERLRRAAADIPAETNLGEAIRRCVLASILDPGLTVAQASRWTAMIAGDPDLRSAATNGYRPWTKALAALIGTRAPTIAPAAAQALAAGIGAMAFESLLGAADTADPLAAVEAALDLLDIHVPRQRRGKLNDQ